MKVFVKLAFVLFYVNIEAFSITSHTKDGVDTKKRNVCPISGYMDKLNEKFLQFDPHFTAKQLSEFNRIAFDEVKNYKDALSKLPELEKTIMTLFNLKLECPGLEKIVNAVIENALDNIGIELNETSKSVSELLDDIYATLIQQKPEFTADELMNFTRKTYQSFKQYAEVLKTQSEIGGYVHIMFNLANTYPELLKSITDTSIRVSKEKYFIRDCDEVHEQKSGVYVVFPDNKPSFEVRCYMNIDVEKWTVIQQRKDGSVNFQRTWKEYREGFGNLEGEFWLGNDKIHRLTSSANYKLRIDISDWNGQSWYAMYNTLKIGDEDSKYQLKIGQFSGTAAVDSMLYHNETKFSTFDRDNDDTSSSCSKQYGNVGWWYKACHKSHLNGLYQRNNNGENIRWYYKPMRFSSMMIRRL